MALNLGSASAVIQLDASNFIANAKAAGDSMNHLQNQTNNVSGNSGFLNWIQANEVAMSRWGKGMMAVGGIMTAAFAVPIIAGSKAAWDQVGAVEQATLALRAYEKDASKVDGVLSGLLEYARSDMGVLFSREELFGAAQSMKIFGAETDNLVGYTEILSRSVGLGLSDWDSLNTVIGRVGATGRLTGNDFDMLTQRGYKLDESLRNTDITWDELFVALDKGMPADALAGQADTIRGKTIRLQSALRNLGLEFLGVDKDTSKFIEGGLGDTLMKGLTQATELLKRMAPAVSNLGRIMASLVRPIGTVVEWILRLPQPVQTAILMFTALSGVAMTTGGAFLLMLPRIASTIAAFQAMGGIPGVLAGVTKALGTLRVAMLAVFTNPAILIGIAAIGLAIAAYKTNFLGFGDLIDSTIGKLRDFFGFTPDTKHATLDIGTAADVEYSDWVQMPDGTWKSTTLDITATGSGPAFVTKVEDASAADGWAYTISVDVDGDGKDDALKIIDSVDQGGGDYVMTATVDDEEYQVWYSETTGEAIVVEVDVQAPASERTANTLEQIMRWISQIKNITSGSFLQDWSNGAAKKIQEMADAFFDFAGMVTSFTWAKIQETDAFRWAEGKLDNLRTLIGYVQSAWNALFGGGDTNNDGRTSVGEQYGLDGPDLNQNGPAEDTGVTRTPRTPSLTKSDGASTPAGDIGSLAGLIANVEESYRRAVPAVSDFGNAIAGTSQPSQQAAIDNNLMASSVLPVGVNMQTADGQVKGASAGINSSFASIAASAITNFTAAQAATVSNMGALASSAVSQAVTAGTGVATQFSTMATKTAASMLGMQAQSGVQLALMASTANTQGAAVNTNLTKGVTSAVSNSRSTLAQLSGIVAGAGANAAWQALSAGANIGNSFASGMESALGRIRAAASAMVGAAMTAVAAKAMIASPSKVFKRYGGFIGEGFEIGIRESYPAIKRAAAGMVPGIESPAFSSPMHMAYGGSTTVIDNSTSSVEYRYFSESDLKHMLETAESGPERAMDLLLTAQSRGTTK